MPEADWQIIRQLFQPDFPRCAGHAMNVAGVMLLRFMGCSRSAPKCGGVAVCYTELFAFITWTSVGLMGARRRGQNLGAGRPDRVAACSGRALRLMIAGTIGLIFPALPAPSPPG